MSALTVGLIIALIAVLAAEFVNGWTDAPNAIATVISTGVMTPRQAVVMAVIMNTVGARWPAQRLPPLLLKGSSHPQR